jgi:hypothetical protein
MFTGIDHVLFLKRRMVRSGKIVDYSILTSFAAAAVFVFFGGRLGFWQKK